METALDHTKDWIHYLTRPFTLFGTSMWQAWYDSERIKALVGASMPDALFIEEHQDVFRSYRKKEQLDALREAVEYVVREEPSRLESIFTRAFELNNEAERAIKEGPDAYDNLDTVIGAATDLALHAAVIPVLALPAIEKITAHAPVREMAEKLRAVSYYPSFNTAIVMPHVARVLEDNGVDASFAPITTLKELRETDFAALEERMKARTEGKRFVYEVSGSQEHVAWIDDPLALIREIEHIPASGDTELRGHVAYRGNAKGTARVVLRSDDTAGIMFEEGNILVSINSSPVLMPLILKSAAIVTDEGGIACHAAIVSRELKIPCVTGTKYATAVIKDGDEIIVDAEAGVVRVVEKGL